MGPAQTQGRRRRRNRGQTDPDQGKDEPRCFADAPSPDRGRRRPQGEGEEEEGRGDRAVLQRTYDSSSDPFSTAMKAACGISTRPIDFIRFLPSFCFSHSFLLREMSPP